MAKVSNKSKLYDKIVIIILLIVIQILLGLNVYFFYQYSKTFDKLKQQINLVPENKVFRTKLEINEYIKVLLIKEPEKVYTFYDTFTNNREITYYIIQYALEYNIPINLFFALAWQESRFTLHAKNKNVNNSYDIGLFQLNTYTFKRYKIDELFNLQTNVKLAAIYLAERYKKYKNWTEAFISYNAGNTIKIGNHTIKHFNNVLIYEEMLNKKFNFYF